MHEREYAKLRKQIEAEYRRKLDALDIVYELSGGPANGVPSTGTAIGKGVLAKAVRAAVDRQPDSFTVRDIENRIIEMRPELRKSINRTSISSALKRLAKDSHIVTRKVGRGKRATVYSGQTDLLVPGTEEVVVLRRRK